jgi:hypothetical protein
MILVNKSAVSLVAGYRIIRDAPAALLQARRREILHAYAARRAVYDRARVRHAFRTAGARWGLNIAAALLLLGLLALALQWRLPNRPALVGAGLVAGGGFWLFQRRLAANAPRPPLDQRALKQAIAQQLQRRWRRGLDSAPLFTGKHGDEGERLFINAMGRALDDRYLMLHSLLQNGREDIDAVILGPRGIWAFEVKHWNGRVRCQDEEWRQFDDQGAPRVRQSPVEQQRRNCRELNRTLSRHVGAAAFTEPRLATIQGGVVFTHAGLELSLGNCVGKDALGSLQVWTRALLATPEWFHDEELLVIIVEALLERHRDVVFAPPPYRSMEKFAHQLVGQMESRLEQWLATGVWPADAH